LIKLMRKRYTLLLGFFMSILALGTVAGIGYYQAVGETVQIFVSPTQGNDSNPGTEDAPFQTINKAKTYYKSIVDRGPVNVWLRGGNYTPLPGEGMVASLSSQDGGKLGAPVSFRAYPGEKVVFTSTKDIDNFGQLTDQAQLNRLKDVAKNTVLVSDLTVLGVADFGDLANPDDPFHGLELFFNDQPMTLARFPNNNWALVGHYPEGDPTSQIYGNQTGEFYYKEEDTPVSWTSMSDVWAQGYWGNNWADRRYRVTEINSDTRKVTLDKALDATLASKLGSYPYGIYPDKRYYFENVFEELDSPGEWYLDRATGKLYFWPPNPIDSANLPKVSVNATELNDRLLFINGASYVNFEGITFSGSRRRAILISNSNHIEVRDNVIRNVRDAGIQLDVSTDCIIANNDISFTGEDAVFINNRLTSPTTGKRITDSSGIVVINNNIHDWSYYKRTYRGGVRLSGVGVRVAHNQFTNSPHTAVLFGGNDTVIENNVFDNVANECSDCGVVYTGRVITHYGSSIKNNIFKNIVGYIGPNPSSPYYDTNGVYIDDGASGINIEGNFFNNTQDSAIFLGGGHDLTVTNNVTYNSRVPFHIDARGRDWMSYKYWVKIIDATITSPIVLTIERPTYYHERTGKLRVEGVQGNEGANGEWEWKYENDVDPINKPDPPDWTKIVLQDSIGTGSYTGGGRTMDGDRLNGTGAYLDDGFYLELAQVNDSSVVDIFRAKYPKMFEHDDYDIANPSNLNITKNIFYRSLAKAAGNYQWDEIASNAQLYVQASNNLVDVGSRDNNYWGDKGFSVIGDPSTPDDPMFVNEGGGDYNFKSDSPVWATGFTQLPFEKMRRYTVDDLLSPISDQDVSLTNGANIPVASLYYGSSEAVSPVYTVDGLPAGSYFDVATKKIVITPSAGALGQEFPVAVNVRDAYLTSSRTCTITLVAGTTSGDTGDQGGSGTSGTTSSSSKKKSSTLQKAVESQLGLSTTVAATPQASGFSKVVTKAMDFVFDKLSVDNPQRAAKTLQIILVVTGFSGLAYVSYSLIKTIRTESLVTA